MWVVEMANGSGAELACRRGLGTPPTLHKKMTTQDTTIKLPVMFTIVQIGGQDQHGTREADEKPSLAANTNLHQN